MHRVLEPLEADGPSIVLVDQNTRLALALADNATFLAPPLGVQ